MEEVAEYMLCKYEARTINKYIVSFSFSFQQVIKASVIFYVKP